jgi:hypothetical protein
MPAQPSETDPLPATGDEQICSAKGCRQCADFDIQWNNPKIHTADRRKHWFACPQHRESLAAFLSARGFLREVVELTATG